MARVSAARRRRPNSRPPPRRGTRSTVPELPEVEVVRRGLQANGTGRCITAVRVHHPRAVRRHEAGPADLTARLLNTRITGTGRRGKYLWLTLGEAPAAACTTRE